MNQLTFFDESIAAKLSTKDHNHANSFINILPLSLKNIDLEN
jgi:hypothetical protein